MNTTAGHKLIANNLAIILDLATYTNITLAGSGEDTLPAIEYIIQPNYGMPQTVSININDNGTITVTTMAEDMGRITETMPAFHLSTILSDDHEAASAAHTRAFPHA